MSAEIFLLGIIIVLLFLLAVLNMALYFHITQPARERKDEEKVQAAMDAVEEDMRRSKEMSEGFDNLMAFEVNLGQSSGGGQ